MALPGTPDDTPVLAPRYYRDNFQHLCTTVRARYADLLLEQEQNFLSGFEDLSATAQCLYIRLISRTGPWFRESRLAYAELGPLAGAVQELLAKGFASEPAALSSDELGGLFTRAELSTLFDDHLGGARFADKSSQLAAIDNLALDARELLPRLREFDGGCILAPAGVELVAVLQLLFFGNRHQSLTEFVLADLGVVRYYSYALDRAYRQFANRAALEEYLACTALSDRHRELVEQGLTPQLPALAQQVLALCVEHDSSRGRWSRLCNALARDLERQDEYATALSLYAASTRHPARERHTRILERLGDWAGARAGCEQILADPWCEEEKEAATRILPRVQRKLGETPPARRRDHFARMDLALPPTAGPVELATAAALQPDWADVRYVENALMNTLFGLAFWQEIFAPVPGAFHHPYQSAPADMYSAQFLAARRDAIKSRLAHLRQADLARELSRAYQAYHPCQCRWVNWRDIDAGLVAAAAHSIPAQHLLAIWQRILFDPASNRRGFPDLIALGSEPGDYCMIEVKGPGDALQDSQKRWLRFFAAQGIPARVAWVQWQDATPS